MNEENDRIHESDPGRLAELMGAEDRPIWGADEPGAVLEHQLDAPLVPALPGSAAVLSRADAADSFRTLRELLHSPAPSVELLRLGKEFAKENRRLREAPLPPEVATVLYFACVVAALVHAHTRITSLDDDDLREGLLWALGRSCLDASMRALLEEGLAAVSPASEQE